MPRIIARSVRVGEGDADLDADVADVEEVEPAKLELGGVLSDELRFGVVLRALGHFGAAKTSWVSGS